MVCGLKLSVSGKKVLIIEKQPVPGGLATTFKRGGFTFESSVHCVDALNKDEDIRDFLDESGISHDIQFIQLSEFARIIYPEHNFVADFKEDNFVALLKKSFPHEEKNISKLFKAINRFNAQFDRFYHSRLPVGLRLLISPLAYPSVIKASLCTIGQFISKYIKDQKLIAIIADIWRFAGLPPSRLSALYFLIIFRGYYCNSTMYVKGGFMRLFKAMVDRIRQLGSDLRFNTKVAKIIAEGGRIKGVVTDKGEELNAKVVVSNANAIDTLTQLIDDQSVCGRYREKLSGMEKSISAFQVYLGLDIPAKALGMSNSIFSVNDTYNHEDNFNYSLQGDYDRCSLELVDHGQVDPELVPQGKGTLLIMTLDSYSNWSALTKEEYEKKKKELADKLIARTEKYLPGLSKHIEVMEVGTPMTVSRFGSSPEGAIYGFAQTVGQAGINRLSQDTDIKGLFLSGAWTMPGGGVHACFVSGIEAADLALRYLK